MVTDSATETILINLISFPLNKKNMPERQIGDYLMKDEKSFGVFNINFKTCF